MHPIVNQDRLYARSMAVGPAAQKARATLRRFVGLFGVLAVALLVAVIAVSDNAEGSFLGIMVVALILDAILFVTVFVMLIRLEHQIGQTA